MKKIWLKNNQKTKKGAFLYQCTLINATIENAAKDGKWECTLQGFFLPKVYDELHEAGYKFRCDHENITTTIHWRKDLFF